MDNINISVSPVESPNVAVSVGYTTLLLDIATDKAETATAIANQAAINANNAALSTLPTSSDQTFIIL